MATKSEKQKSRVYSTCLRQKCRHRTKDDACSATHSHGIVRMTASDGSTKLSHDTCKYVTWRLNTDYDVGEASWSTSEQHGELQQRRLTTSRWRHRNGPRQDAGTTDGVKSNKIHNKNTTTAWLGPHQCRRGCFGSFAENRHHRPWPLAERFLAAACPDPSSLYQMYQPTHQSPVYQSPYNGPLLCGFNEPIKRQMYTII